MSKTSKTTEQTGTWRVLRIAAFARKLDGNAAWNATGVANKVALIQSLLALPKGEAPKGGKQTWLRISGQAGEQAWKVTLDKRGIYSRACPESGTVVGSLAAFKAGKVSVKTSDDKKVAADNAAIGIDKECVAFYGIK